MPVFFGAKGQLSAPSCSPSTPSPSFPPLLPPLPLPLLLLQPFLTPPPPPPQTVLDMVEHPVVGAPGPRGPRGFRGPMGEQGSSILGTPPSPYPLLLPPPLLRISHYSPRPSRQAGKAWPRWPRREPRHPRGRWGNRNSRNRGKRRSTRSIPNARTLRTPDTLPLKGCCLWGGRRAPTFVRLVHAICAPRRSL